MVAGQEKEAMQKKGNNKHESGQCIYVFLFGYCLRNMEHFDDGTNDLSIYNCFREIIWHTIVRFLELRQSVVGVLTVLGQLRKAS